MPPPGWQPAVSRAAMAACNPPSSGQSSRRMTVSYSAAFTVEHPIGKLDRGDRGVGPDCNTAGGGPAIWTGRARPTRSVAPRLAGSALGSESAEDATDVLPLSNRW